MTQVAYWHVKPKINEQKSGSGHELIGSDVRAESALPSSAEMRWTERHVGFVPLSEVGTHSITSARTTTGAGLDPLQSAWPGSGVSRRCPEGKGWVC